MTVATTLLSITGFFIFATFMMAFVYSKYEKQTGDTEGKGVLLIIICIMLVSTLGFGICTACMW